MKVMCEKDLLKAFLSQ